MPEHFADSSISLQICMPSLVVLFDCPAAVAKDRFLARKREDGDNEAMFAKRYAEFETNNQIIMERYAETAKIVRAGCDMRQMIVLLTIVPDFDPRRSGHQLPGIGRANKDNSAGDGRRRRRIERRRLGNCAEQQAARPAVPR
jgi:hypothetical protein